MAQRHGDKDIREQIIEEAPRRGWRVTKGNNYWMIWCPRDCKCKKTVKSSPSDPRYLQNLIGHLNRATCWRKK